MPGLPRQDVAEAPRDVSGADAADRAPACPGGVRLSSRRLALAGLRARDRRGHRVSDLLSHEVVLSNRDYVGWWPREGFTRGKATAEYVRSMRDAGWGIHFTDVSARLRYVRLHPQFHPNEGYYVECGREAPGATPTWRCELRYRPAYVTSGNLQSGDAA